MPQHTSPPIPAHILAQRRAPLLLVALILIAAVAPGCRALGTGTTSFEQRARPVQGDARSFRMGSSDVPWALTEQAQRQAYDMAAQYGEVILVQRSPAWGEFLPGGHVSDALRDQTLAIREGARQRGLLVTVALDPFDPAARERLQKLPSSHAGRDFGDEGLREAFVAEAVFVARNVRPAYLVLGTEVNATFERNPAGYLAYVRAYREAYDAVKAAQPETAVFPSFQYEELLGVIPELPPHTPRWPLLKDFAGKVDMLGITTYPSFAYPVARKVPADYYSRIREQTALPVAFVSVGFASGAGRDGVNSSTPAEQRRFLQRLFEDADALASPLVVWFVLRDLSFATTPPFDLVANIGLRDTTDRPKEGWPVWEAASNRAYDPAAAEVGRLRRAASATPTATPSR
ncbi:MAG: hypothetical protein EXR64_04260 [Dehalococcoidia bacterium]|nr:hypothetical protein [Dehalococcoidia bacterium]